MIGAHGRGHANSATGATCFRAAWAGAAPRPSGWPRTRCWSARSRSRCSPRGSPPTRAGSRASAGRPAWQQGSPTRIWSPSMTSRAERASLHRHGAHAGRVPLGSPPGGRRVGPRRPRARSPLRARVAIHSGRDHPPRHQAGERALRPRRNRMPDRLRRRAARGRDLADADRPHSGHRPLHGARAVAGPPRRRADGPLRRGHRAAASDRQRRARADPRPDRAPRRRGARRPAGIGARPRWPRWVEPSPRRRRRSSRTIARRPRRRAPWSSSPRHGRIAARRSRALRCWPSSPSSQSRRPSVAGTTIPRQDPAAQRRRATRRKATPDSGNGDSGSGSGGGSGPEKQVSNETPPAVDPVALDQEGRALIDAGRPGGGDPDPRSRRSTITPRTRATSTTPTPSTTSATRCSWPAAPTRRSRTSRSDMTFDDGQLDTVQATLDEAHEAAGVSSGGGGEGKTGEGPARPGEEGRLGPVAQGEACLGVDAERPAGVLPRPALDDLALRARSASSRATRPRSATRSASASMAG